MTTDSATNDASAKKISLPSRSRVVVVGGGVIGTSITYHLAHLGVEVLLLERDQLTSGTTWHAAGLMVTFGSMSETSTELRKYTRALHQLGSRDWPGDRVQAGWLHRDCHRAKTASKSSAGWRPSTATAASTCTRSRRGEVQDLFPLARTDDILAGFYVKEDGHVNPVDVTMSMAKGAKMQGATSSKVSRSRDS